MPGLIRVSSPNESDFPVQGNIATGAIYVEQLAGTPSASTPEKAEDSASANLDVGIPAMAVRKATPANTSGTDGDYEMLQMSEGRLWTSSIGPTLTNVSSTAYETSHVLLAAAGKLFGVTGYNSKSSEQFIQLHNTTTVPADTAVPVVVFKVSPLSSFSLDFGLSGRNFSTGITVCNSSTGPIKTVGSADCWFDAQVL